MSDPVQYQVMWNRLISVVEEQAQALIRTAFSTSVREAGDLSAGVYDARGRMIAQAVTGTPGHVNAMAEAVEHFMRRIGVDTMAQGDVYLTNDPWEGTGHLHDITVVTPVFLQGELIGFFASTAHIVDIGGRGWGPDANSIYEEGLYIPQMRFLDQGTVNQTLIQIIRANVREPDQLVGDVYALATCNDIGHARLIDMMTEFGLRELGAVADYIFARSRQATLAAIQTLPRQTADHAVQIDGFASPVTLAIRLSVGDDHLLCDFAGTSGLDPKGINVPLVYTKAYACYALKCAIAPEIPNNWASLAPFRVSAPENCILNAVHPAPVALRHVIGHMVPDAVYGALDQILPNTVPAEGAGALCNFQVSIRPRQDSEGMGHVGGADGNVDGNVDGPMDQIEAAKRARRSEILTFNSGGSGARPTLDGMNTTAFPSGVMTMPVEATEQAGPVLILRKELRPDSGGAGRTRGGLGQYMSVGVAAGHEYDFSAMFDRVDHPAAGRQGGQAGAPTFIRHDDGTAMRGKGRQFVPPGKVVEMGFPGGAGYGNPSDRDGEAVKRDLALGYISEATAREVYGLPQADIDAVSARVAMGEEF